MVYLPMGYIYGRRITAPESPLVLSLRKVVISPPHLCQILKSSANQQELYPNDEYAKIKWRSLRSYVSPLDLYYPHSMLLELLYGLSASVMIHVKKFTF